MHHGRVNRPPAGLRLHEGSRTGRRVRERRQAPRPLGWRHRSPRQVQSGPRRAGISTASIRQNSSPKDPTWSSACTTRRTGEGTTDQIEGRPRLCAKGWPRSSATSCTTGRRPAISRFPPDDRNAEIVSEMTAQVPIEARVHAAAHASPREGLRSRLILPTGEDEDHLQGNWDFNWQLGFDLARADRFPKGTRIVGICALRQFHREQVQSGPAKLVVWGNQNWDEMQNCFIELPGRSEGNQRTFFKASGPSLLKARRFGADARSAAPGTAGRREHRTPARLGHSVAEKLGIRDRGSGIRFEFKGLGMEVPNPFLFS